MKGGPAATGRRSARELFARYPGTMALPWVELATLPAPIEPFPALAEAAGAGALWVKRDDLAGDPYGGNKVRKLEFLLGEALAAGASDVITFGAAGSNHALATALYGARVGLRVHSMLMSQPNARYVRRNLLAGAAAGADLHHFPDRAHAMRAAAALRRRLRARTGREPYVIPFGGTTPLSSAGFVSAGLELGTQLEYHELPEPDAVYVPLGSMGTAAGIGLGMRAAGLRTRLVGVPVVSYEMDSPQALLDLIRRTQDVIRAAEPAFPALRWSVDDFDIARGFLGEEYARFTAAGMEAVALAGKAGLHLEGTYTGKTLAALLAHGRAGALEGRTVLLWDTYNSRDTSSLMAGVSADVLPARLRAYFEQDVQELDRETS
jgi:1-aminocyclopropane-1-carboxylate deaminase/D-cysteine desulfhydrase-like pyridoxal-dependent ACC family enzyme